MSLIMATAFAPASVGNVGVGFDILGHSLEGAGDTVTVRKTDTNDIRVTAISGTMTELPLETENNTAARALRAMREDLQLDYGYQIEIVKGIALGSGMGGSAASATAAVVAANALLETPLPREALYRYALEGEAAASGSYHGDNVGPQLLGGLVLATRDSVIAIPTPGNLYCALVHPHFVLETRKAREALSGHYALKEFIGQSEGLALLLAGCFKSDFAMIQKSLHDVLIEPRRSPLIPGFANVKQSALDNGALGSSISGAGPSVFAWCIGEAVAKNAAQKMQRAFLAAGLESDIFVSKVAGPRAEVLSCSA
ncbi:MAG: homoserine kinase [Arenimonas sp.]